MLTATPQTIASSGSNDKNKATLYHSVCVFQLMDIFVYNPHCRTIGSAQSFKRQLQLAVALTLARLGGVNTKAYHLLYSPPI